VVFCNTKPLQCDDLRSSVLYDKVALSPLAKVLGLYQNRSPELVTSHHVVQVENSVTNNYSVRLQSVPNGPVTRVLFDTGAERYTVLVQDRSLKNNTLYVRAEARAKRDLKNLRSRAASNQ